jgi:DNA-binding LytR/AlgR family response regulator
LDDELPGLAYLKMLCGQISEIEVIKAFDSPESFIEESEKLNFDFCILDIEMPRISGLEVANLFQNKPIIFTTAYKEYAANAFDLNAVDYLIKPIKLERLRIAVEKVIDRLKRSKENKVMISLNTEKGKTSILSDNILYITASEIDSRDKIALLSNGSRIFIKNMSFEKLMQVLPENEFCRVNRKEVIALSSVTAFTNDKILTRILSETGNLLEIQIGNGFRQSLLNKSF